ncbi:MAG: hypothetical protein M1357_02290 [Candidatus Marsarchaeota archaeon]|nr:hypothetical protein [Candidatus Marsarchaeota archaeon]
MGIDRETASRLSEYAKKIVKLKEYTGCVKFRLFTPGEAGADRIRSALQDIEKYLSGKGVKPKVYVVAAPRYAAEFTSDKPKLVNLVMKEAAEEVVRAAKQWRLEASVEG